VERFAVFHIRLKNRNIGVCLRSIDSFKDEWTIQHREMSTAIVERIIPDLLSYFDTLLFFTISHSHLEINAKTADICGSFVPFVARLLISIYLSQNLFDRTPSVHKPDHCGCLVMDVINNIYNFHKSKAIARPSEYILKVRYGFYDQ